MEPISTLETFKGEVLTLLLAVGGAVGYFVKRSDARAERTTATQYETDAKLALQKFEALRRAKNAEIRELKAADQAKLELINQQAALIAYLKEQLAASLQRQ